jgi:hypothetical protein
MPLSDKELALKILEFAENCVLESAIYQVLLGQHVPNWQSEYQRILAQSGEVQKMIHEKLDTMRERVFEAPDLSAVVEQLLKDIQKNDQA